MMNQKEFALYLKRAAKFYLSLSGQIWGESKTLNTAAAVSKHPVPFGQRSSMNYAPVRENDVWGKLWDSAWFHVEDEFPAEFAGKEIAFRFNLGGEALVFSPSGVPEYNLTNTSVFISSYRKEIYRPRRTFRPGEKIDLWIEVAANGLFGDEINPDVPGQICDVGLIRHIKLCEFRSEVWNLMLDMEVLFGLMNVERPAGDFVFGHPAFPKDSRRMTYLLRKINRAIDLYADNPANAVAARAVLAEEMKRPAAASAMTVTAVGHAHIDTGWLWPVRETVRKCARTFAGQLALMEKYPDYVFGASQPQHYAFIKEHYPELYEKIRARVKEGRWELQGAMWVEADCNLIGGESMVRQFLHGKNFYLKEFGVEVKNLWLPDVFGYSGALPQIIRKSGCDSFLTQKICWNQFNRFPYHAFTWQGIDGSEVLTFFPPEDTYNSLLVPDQLNYGCDNLTENYLLDESLTLFGVGDGGGGPKEEHVERGMRCADLDGSPKVRFGRADDFFERLAGKQSQLPHWYGELYFELHRGTLTTQALAKRNNRRAEQELLETEILASMLSLSDYPAAAFDAAWKKLLLNQFHDIIPGSSIRAVYAVSETEYAGIFQSLAEIRNQVVATLGRPDENALTVVNTLPYAYTRLVELPESFRNKKLTCNGEKLRTQGRFAAVVLPSLSVSVLRAEGEEDTSAAAPSTEGRILENDLIRYEFDGEGRLVGAFDKDLRREMLSAPGNVFTLYADVPNSYDAWDIDVFYENEIVENAVLTDFSIVEKGPLRQCAKLAYRVGASQIGLEVSLEANSKRLEFHAHVSWHENRRMLRVAFPCSVSSNECTCEIQYGSVRRGTHRNNSWNLAQFEMTAHRYVDLSDSVCGVALLNDCKYGHKVHDNVLDLNLLRSPSWPDANADRGEHEFTYALLPHVGTLSQSRVIEEAAMLNRKARSFEFVDCSGKFPCGLRTIQGTVTLEVIKKAENESERVIRLAELCGEAASVEILLTGDDAVYEADLMERTQAGELAVSGRRFRLDFRPFEIRTFVLRAK